MDKRHRGSINGRRYSSAKVLSLRSSRYADAKDWDDLVPVFTDSPENSSPDEMILLMHVAVHGPHEQQPEWVRPVSYGRLSEIPRLLLSAAPSALRTGDAPVDQQQPHVEAVIGTQSEGQEQQKRIDDVPQERVADANEAEVVMPSEYRGEIDEAQVNAAKVLLDVYRRRLRQKNVVRQGIEATQAHYWDLLRKRSMKIKWPKDSQYYLLFRVPLGHILVCLDVIGTFADSEKKEAKKRMMTEDHKGLEDSMETLNQHRYDSADCTLYQVSNGSSSKLLKKTINLQKKLAPTSKFHGARSINDLQQAVLEVKAIVERLDDIPRSIETRNQIKKLWDQGFKWIFEKQRGAQRKGRKP